ncbi:MAG: PEP-CTERM sorting domain-containing protein [Pseudomonadota bacterium]
MSMLKPLIVTVFLGLTGIHSVASAAIVWSGPDVIVTQADNSPNSVTDVMVDGIASLGRGISGPLCNVLAGDVCDSNSALNPTGFAWAFDGFDDNVITYGDADRFADLNFTLGITAAVDFSPAFDLLDRAGVGHILGSDIYFDIQFSRWQRGGGGNGNGGSSGVGGGFSYQRSSAAVSVPEPALVSLFAVGLIGVAVMRRKKLR